MRPLISAYVDNVNQQTEAWQDEFHPAGSYAIAELVLADVVYVTQLARLLFCWNMGHETYHCALVSQVFRKFGCRLETTRLLAARVGADGQHADDDVRRALELVGFREALDLEEFSAYLYEYTPEIQDWRFEAFAGIYATYDTEAFRRAMRAFANAFGRKGLLDIAEDRDDMFEENLQSNGLDEFEEGAGTDGAGKLPIYGDDWNATFEDVSVGLIDPAKLSALPLAIE